MTPSRNVFARAMNDPSSLSAKEQQQVAKFFNLFASILDIFGNEKEEEEVDEPGSDEDFGAGATIANGISLHVGLNRVDPAMYGGWDGTLKACVNDANSMQAIANRAGFSSTRMVDSGATRRALQQAVSNAARALNGGDTFLLTYSGHGGRVPDRDGDEIDKYDETWCLFDGQMLDDEIYTLLCGFRPGVNIIVISDSCHSGTVTRVFGDGYAPVPSGRRDSIKSMPDSVAMDVYKSTGSWYDNQRKYLRSVSTEPQGPILLLSGCMENQYSYDGEVNGAFTTALLQVWSNGDFDGTWKSFWRSIAKKLPENQSPNLFLQGPGQTLLKESRPFTI